MSTTSNVAKLCRLFLLAIPPLIFAALALIPLATAQGIRGQRLALPRSANWRGDFPGILKRRTLRILVPYSKTFFFIDRGKEMGVVAEFGRALENWINSRYKFNGFRFHVDFLPTARDRLIHALIDGEGDVIAANLTITPERLELIDFADPWLTDVKEILVTGPSSPRLASIDDLSGREIYVRRSSSYSEHLETLNRRFAASGVEPAIVKAIDENLEDEDIIEMVNAGLLPYAVVDNHLATIWSKIFPNLVPRNDLAISEGGEVAWAARKESPQLKAELNSFFTTHRTGTSFGNTIKRRYFAKVRTVRNALEESDAKKFVAVIDLFRRYSSQYNFDYLMIAAQAYQESKLDQSRRSGTGVVGLMQIKPSTAASAPIRITGVDRDAGRNVQAGCAYLRYLADNYVSDSAVDPLNRTLMSFAAYNAGPRNLRKSRDRARQDGLNPNIWFNNVEVGAAKVIGFETTQYVSNIYKYYVTYQMSVERLEARKKGRRDNLLDLN